MSAFRIKHWFGLAWTFSKYDTRRSIRAYTPMPEDKRVFSIDAEFAAAKFPWRFGAGIQLTPSEWEPNIRIYLAFLGRVWITIGWPGLYNWLAKRRSGEWRIELTIGDDFSAYGGLPVELSWQNGGWWMSGTSRDGSFNFADWILGRVECTSVTIRSGNFGIVMPEGRYPANYEIKEYARKRTRALRGKTERSIYFEIPDGVPVPGKGENSWDIDDDAIFGIGTSWDDDDTLRSAGYRVALRILHDRYRHGSLDWIPDRGFDIGKSKEVVENV